MEIKSKHLFRVRLEALDAGNSLQDLETTGEIVVDLFRRRQREPVSIYRL
jgi:hypothetical protein